MHAHGIVADKEWPPLVAVCGCYAEEGLPLLEELASFLVEYDVNAATASQKFPLAPTASSREKRDSSRRLLKRASGVLFVALSPGTLEVGAGADITGGWAYEVGLIDGWSEHGELVWPAVLYDGEATLRTLSSMLKDVQLGPMKDVAVYEAISEKGNIGQLKALSLHLCRRLLMELILPGFPAHKALNGP